MTHKTYPEGTQLHALMPLNIQYLETLALLLLLNNQQDPLGYKADVTITLIS